MPESYEPRIAERAECLAALKALYNDTDRLRKLKGYARMMTFFVRGAQQFAEPDDLISEAVIRTLEGRRVWKPEEADFDIHLRGCVRSIAAEYAGKFIQQLKAMPPEQQSKEVRLHDAIFEKTRTALQDERIALTVLNRLLAGESPAEIRKNHNIDVSNYNAARKKISRRLKLAFLDITSNSQNDVGSSWSVGVFPYAGVAGLRPPSPPALMPLLGKVAAMAVSAPLLFSLKNMNTRQQENDPPADKIVRAARNLIEALCEDPFEADTDDENVSNLAAKLAACATRFSKEA